MTPKLYLAPLAGVTDSAFRRICKEHGADVLCTEMISAKGLYYNDKKTSRLSEFDTSEHPIGIQLFGCEPGIMAYAVAAMSERRPDFIDINMGCPMPKIVKNGDGSALMKDPVLAGKVIEAAVKATSLPVSVKFRAGWSEGTVNAVEFAKVCQESGAARITVHPRTREQLYTGKADHSVTAAVKASVKIPVIANGDIFSPEDCMNVLRQTGCDGAMIARGAMGNPFIFEQIKSFYATGEYSAPSAAEKMQTAKKHLQLMCEITGDEKTSVIEARKHMAWYLKGLRGGAACKTEIFSATTKQQVLDILNRFITQL